MTQFPRTDWSPEYQVCSADSEGSTRDAAPTGEDTHTTACEGARCLERAASGLQRPPGLRGPTGWRCRRCRATELEDSLTSDLQQLLESEAYQNHTTTLQETRTPSHLEFGALLIQEGHAPASVTRICQALGRLGVAHSEDLQGGDPAPQPHGSRLPRGACPACRGRHRRHTCDHRCRRETDTGAQALIPSARSTLQPRRYGTPRRPRLDDAGPHFLPCPVAARTPEAATTNARLAMQQLASSSTPYPAAQASTQVPPSPVSYTHLTLPTILRV